MGGGLSVRPPTGGWLVAVSVAEGTAAIGAYHRHINLPPPRRLVAERRGEFVHVGFDWPADVAEVLLTYRVGADHIATGRIESRLVEVGRIEPGRLDDDGPHEELVTRAAYDSQGGVRLPVPENEPVELSIAATGTVGGARVTGPEATAEVAGRTVVHYDIERSGPRWRRSLTIRLTSAKPLRIAKLELVMRAGRVMPHRAADGETLGSWEQVPVPGELTLAPPDASGPYWLRCFADDDVIDLSDPPVRHLQVTR